MNFSLLLNFWCYRTMASSSNLNLADKNVCKEKMYQLKNFV